jgi:hypothetical protein
MIYVPFELSKMDGSYQLIALGLSRHLGNIIEPVGFEIEGQLAHHIKGNDHTELNGLAILRWLPFPWDRIIDTSFAFGPGLSYASELPIYERAHFTRRSRLLAYVLWEVEMFYPRLPSWRAVARLHHRSGAYGTFNGVYAGSNFVGLGIKYTF